MSEPGILEKFRLHGKVAVVTGGNSGIGLGVARGLAQAGADVAVWARDPDRNREAVAQLEQDGVKALAVACDVSDPAQVEAAAERTLAWFGRIDTCVAAAGVNAQTPFVDTELEEFRRVTGTNLEGTFLTFRAVARHMVENEGGSLLAVSSISSHSGQPRSAHYAASKAGVTAVVKSLAVELARYGVRANAVIPGWIETPMIQDFLANERFVERVLKRVPHRRWGTPEDLAGLAVYLASPAASYVTGAEIIVDGGYTLF
ncbi:SDR family NAD(P)-dependent oxidoreductase [Streptomyces griseoviridis]|uniref:SDR family NAD(P)-dependent oxidoreductase n=1 Tax=Streptomyces hintoniae TaxID=3075521 RepID=A0ABU2UTA4_9ACTN|nr:SDR family NAD(P)-dependent oxidoreductase [Streptomyces sp. DSM 41014]MDT0476290.1 SDR family NAD(P)-dependent oxidoreductase [Streptomyces sp. DSM 41014]